MTVRGSVTEVRSGVEVDLQGVRGRGNRFDFGRGGGYEEGGESDGSNPITLVVRRFMGFLYELVRKKEGEVLS